jgi:hypothetical protein
MSSSPTPAVDVVHPDDITHLAAHRGPALSVFIPTARHGPETQQGPTRLRNLVRSVTSHAEATFGADTTSQLLRPVLAMADDSSVWQHQADGLAIFATPTEHRTYRLPITLAEDAVVGERFRLRPMVGYLAGHDVFYVLALAQNSLRIFEATTQSIDELPTEHLPASIDDALRFEDPEQQLQSQSVGGGDVSFHGHGAGEELDKQSLARYFRAVDRGLVETLGATTLPVVIACVDYYLPIYHDITNLANVMDVAVAGNPEHRSAAELHGAALPLIQPIVQQRTTAIAARYQELAGTGRTITDLAALTTAAGEGRIDTLFVTADDPTPLDPATLTEIDRVIADAINTGATISIAQPSLIEGAVAAILRY